MNTKAQTVRDAGKAPHIAITASQMRKQRAQRRKERDERSRGYDIRKLEERERAASVAFCNRIECVCPLEGAERPSLGENPEPTDQTHKEGQTTHQAFRTLQGTLARVRESYEGCSCECVEANQDEHGFWTPKHECLPCEVKRVMRETIWHTYGDRVQPGFNPLKKPPPFGD